MARDLTLGMKCVLCILCVFSVCSCGGLYCPSQHNVTFPADTCEDVSVAWRNGLSWFQMDKSQQRRLTEYLRKTVRKDSLGRSFYFYPSHTPMPGIPGDYVTLSKAGEELKIYCHFPFQVQRIYVVPFDGQEGRESSYDFYLTPNIVARSNIPRLFMHFNFAEPSPESIDFFWLHLQQPNDTTLIVKADKNPNIYYGREMQVLCVSETGHCDYHISGLLRVRQLQSK